MKYWMLLFAFLWVSYGTGMARKTEKIVNNGIPWFDDRGEIVNAHGACIVEENGRYYLFGEYKSDKSNAFPGFSCYSSDDLVNWKFERVVLPMQSSGILGPDRVGERVKVMKCRISSDCVIHYRLDRRHETWQGVLIRIDLRCCIYWYQFIDWVYGGYRRGCFHNNR